MIILPSLFLDNNLKATVAVLMALAAVKIAPSALVNVASSSDEQIVQLPSNSKCSDPFRNVLILRKPTRWHFEMLKHPGWTADQLESYLIEKGENGSDIRKAGQFQYDAALHILDKFRERGINATLVTIKELPSMVSTANLIVSAGGDGTFLSAAASVSNNTPVVGINTDPIGSEGHLLFGGKNPPADFVDRLVERRFKCAKRSRIRVTILNQNRTEVIPSCKLALNEVFIGENDAAKVSTYLISFNGQPFVKQKSSGIIVSTGTGSTSWFYGMNRLEDQTVASFLEAMQSLGIQLGGTGQGLPIKTLAEQIANKMNERIAFDPENPNFAYFIREPIFNATFKRTSIRGFASKIELKSRCERGFLVLDGHTRIPFNRGTEVRLEVLSSDALNTIEML